MFTYEMGSVYIMKWSRGLWAFSILQPVRLRAAETLSFTYFLNVRFRFLLFIPEQLMFFIDYL